ncbi:MAG: nucleotidyltransferase domain-containing protein, partial [Elusimicrobiota bacterium]
YEKNIAEILNNFFSQKKDILFAYWYGSRNEYTDIDIAVYIKPENIKNCDLFDFNITSEIANLLDKDVDVIVLNNAHLEMRYSVQKGLLVFERDKKVRVDFEVKARLQYWDFLPVLRIHMEGARKKLRKLFPEVYKELDAARNK